MELDSTNVEGYAKLGLVLLQQKKPREAVEAAEKALAIDPKNQQALFVKGMSLSGTDHPRPELWPLRNSTASESSNISTHLLSVTICLILSALHRYSQAALHWQHAISLYPTHVKFYLYRALALSSMKEYKAALKSVDEALKIDPQSTEAMSLKESLIDAILSSPDLKDALN